MDVNEESPIHRLVLTDDFHSQFQARLEDPNERDDSGYTLLHKAALSPKDNSRNLQLLLHQGADVNVITPDGYTPLQFAVFSRKRDTVQALLEAGASVNSKDRFGRSALHFSVWVDPTPCDMWIVKKLVCHPDINLNSVDHIGETPLMLAVVKRRSDAVQELLKKGADPNIANQDGRTPLHEAFPCEGIVSALLSNGAGIYCADKYGETPIDILVSNLHTNESFLFAKEVLCVVALRYRIKDCLQRKLGKIPVLSEHFEKCCKEVKLMMSQIIYDKFTLHDFVLGCFQSWVVESDNDIYTAVVELLYSEESYNEYLNLIVERFF